MTPKNNDWMRGAVSPDAAVATLESGMGVFLHGGCATPTELLAALARRTDLEGILIYHLHTIGPAPHLDPECSGRLRSVSMFTGQPARRAVREGRADYVPVFLSDIPALFLSGRTRIDAALLQLSPPDKHGMCTLGPSVDAARAAADVAKVVIGMINDRMPRTHGHGAVPFDRLTAFTCVNRPLHEHVPDAADEVERRIGDIVAGLIEDRSCLQMGIGAIPDAVLERLKDKHDLGVHTEMFSDRLVDLVEAGVVTNRYKDVHPGRIVTSFVIGTQRVFDFVDDNPLVEFHPCDRTNDTSLIRRNDRTVAINSAIQVDLSGQVCADSIGHEIFSGIGGQMDFIRGAALSHGGKPILAFPSTAKRGTLSRIVPELTPGAGVVTTRGHVHWVVTEYGAVNLHGMNLRERGQALVSIAHPDFRPELLRALAQIRHYPVS